MRRLLFLAACLVACAMSGPSALAAIYTSDAAPGDSGATEGSGTWRLSRSLVLTTAKPLTVGINSPGCMLS